ncbi:HNH endonuclease [Mycobacterium phage Marge]|nr:HNH endonuclease [Mycobacterium phage Marge]
MAVHYPESLLPDPKVCAHCEQPMPEGKRPHAVYCDRRCKTAAAETRRPPRDNHARYLKERERRLAYSREYQKRNPDVPKRAKRKRRALIAGRETFTITQRDWLRLVRRHNHRCFYCEAPGPMSMDHVVPISRGGRHSIGNIVPACISCNSSKRDRTVVEWRLSKRGHIARVA